ncbi:MAG: dihydrodipicolinate reductase [Chloroflexi bacterium]|nr:dihydrodipicolinate reductase [Chloroflexota bacterium]
MSATRQPVRAVLFGIGPIGAGIGRLAAQREEIELAGAIDSAPDKAGRRLYDVLELDPPAGKPNPVIEADAAAALASAKPDVVLHATSSYLVDTAPQLIACAQAGANVVSTCEELSYPWLRHPELAKQLDAEAKANGVTLLGTGINPGFVMDTLAVTLGGVCQTIERIRLTRIVDVGTRRPQLQRKVGVGLSAEEFREKAAAGRFGHVGLKESCWLIAAALGWRFDEITETLEPVAGPDGAVAGQLQTVRGVVDGRTVIEAVVQMSIDAERPRDEIEIEGTPSVRMVLEGGVPGDQATPSVIVNAVPGVIAHSGGLATMLDLPPAAGRGAAP